MALYLPFNADAESKLLTTDGAGSTLILVGHVTTEKIALQVQAVENPNVATDTDWEPFEQNDEEVVLRKGNRVIKIPAFILLRVVKDAGVDGLVYGMRVS